MFLPRELAKSELSEARPAEDSSEQEY